MTTDNLFLGSNLIVNSGISRIMLGIGVCCVQTPLVAFSPDQHRETCNHFDLCSVQTQMSV
ncbi:hypothetical protein T03_7860 [Trichinella britovi]|uniref:Uncharacterized protein n=1 Tax=Trichinella britovi TaxID=45882 RepID=A0A0V0Z7P1_TRIBR|nr:hypothetical protein T03_7860 [Trichinella britovi]